MYQKAAVLVVRIRPIGIVTAITIELLCTTIQYYKIPVICGIISVYIEISRNMFLMVQLFFIYYGLPQIGIQANAAVCGVAGLTFLGRNYMLETFCSEIEAIASIQEEGAYSLGLSKLRTFSCVILPQIFSISVPVFIADVIFLLKEASVSSAISLTDLVFIAKGPTGSYYKAAESLFLLVMFYLITLLLISVLGNLLEKRSRYAKSGS